MPPPALDDLSRARFRSCVGHHADNRLIAIYSIEVEVGNGFAQTTEVSVTFNEAGVGGGVAKCNVSVIFAGFALSCCQITYKGEATFFYDHRFNHGIRIVRRVNGAGNQQRIRKAGRGNEHG